MGFTVRFYRSHSNLTMPKETDAENIESSGKDWQLYRSYYLFYWEVFKNNI